MVRKATLADLEALVSGNRSMARETEGIDLDPEVLRAGVRAVLEGKQPGEYRVIDDENGRVVAQLMLTYEWSDWRNRMVWWIQSVFVDPSARRRGMYATLFRAVIEEARTAGAAGIRLYVDQRNEVAQKTYEALGMDGGHYTVYETMLSDLPAPTS